MAGNLAPRVVALIGELLFTSLSGRWRIWAWGERTLCGERPQRREPRMRIFFSLWKNADPDVPILVAAKAEYAKLE